MIEQKKTPKNATFKCATKKAFSFDLEMEQANFKTIYIYK